MTELKKGLLPRPDHHPHGNPSMTPRLSRNQPAGYARSVFVAFMVMAGILLGSATPLDAQADTNRDADALYRQGATEWRAGRYDDALSPLKRAAEAGHAAAAFFVGEVYRRGLGSTAEDFAIAAQWYLRSAERGEGRSMMALFNAYMGGSGVPRDRGVAERWARRAADAGQTEGMKAMGRITKERGSMDESLAWNKMAAERGDRYAMQIVALFYYYGWVPKNYVEAARWFVRSGEAGTPEAFTTAGRLHEQGGFGLTADRAEAIRLYRRGASAGHQHSKDALARLGVPLQEAEASVQSSGLVITERSAAPASNPTTGAAASPNLLERYVWCFAIGAPMHYSEIQRIMVPAGDGEVSGKLGRQFAAAVGRPAGHCYPESTRAQAEIRLADSKEGWRGRRQVVVDVVLVP